MTERINYNLNNKICIFLHFKHARNIKISQERSISNCFFLNSTQPKSDTVRSFKSLFGNFIVKNIFVKLLLQKLQNKYHVLFLNIYK